MKAVADPRPISREALWNVILAMGGRESTITAEIERVLHRAVMTTQEMVGDQAVMYPHTFGEVEGRSQRAESSRSFEQRTGLVFMDQA